MPPFLEWYRSDITMISTDRVGVNCFIEILLRNEILVEKLKWARKVLAVGQNVLRNSQ